MPIVSPCWNVSFNWQHFPQMFSIDTSALLYWNTSSYVSPHYYVSFNRTSSLIAYRITISFCHIKHGNPHKHHEMKQVALITASVGYAAIQQICSPLRYLKILAKMMWPSTMPPVYFSYATVFYWTYFPPIIHFNRSSTCVSWIHHHKMQITDLTTSRSSDDKNDKKTRTTVIHHKSLEILILPLPFWCYCYLSDCPVSHP